MELDFPSLDKGLAGFEKTLNTPDHIPFVSFFSGVARMGYGKLEVIAAVAFAAIKLVSSFLAKTDDDKKKLLDEAKYTLNYVVHGLSNIFRGYVAAIPLINLTTWMYDSGAATRIHYENEAKDPSFNYPMKPLFPLDSLSNHPANPLSTASGA